MEKQKIDSIKAIALIRSYRIRGHLIANLDPLGMMKREYLHELHPSDHGFKKEDYERKIYLSSYLDTSYSTIKDIMFKLRRVYCATIGAEYMHISDPVEKIWFRERMEKNENQINFTNKGKKAILKTIKAGGCSCSRVNFIGAYFAALKGLDTIPKSWIKKTDPAKRIIEQK